MLDATELPNVVDVDCAAVEVEVGNAVVEVEVEVEVGNAVVEVEVEVEVGNAVVEVEVEVEVGNAVVEVEVEVGNAVVVDVLLSPTQVIGPKKLLP